MVWNLRTHGERLSTERTPNTCKTTKEVDGLARTAKAKASPPRAKAKASKTKVSLARAKARTKTKERVNTTARKGRQDVTKWRARRHVRHPHRSRLHRMDGHELGARDSWTDEDWWSSDWSTTSGTTVGTAATCSRTVQSNPKRGGSISMFDELTMCELSVGDERHQSEQDDGNKHWYDNWNNWNENWVQNEMTGGHKIELTEGHRSWNNLIWDKHWIQNKMTGCRRIWDRSWNDRIGETNWMQSKLTSGHNIWNRNWRDKWVCDKLTGHSIESVGHAAVVRQDKRCGQTTFGVDTAACRTVVPARHPATRGYKCHCDTERRTALDSWQVCCAG